MGNDGATQPPRGHRDMRDVGGTQQPVRGQQHDKQNSQPGQDWQEIAKLLNEVKDNLTKEEEVSPRHRILLTVEKAIQRVNALQRQYEDNTIQSDTAKTQLDLIEAGINEIRQEMQKGIPPGATPMHG